MNTNRRAETVDNHISCIILAGGQGKRVESQDKGLITFEQKPLVQHAIESVRPQCNEIIISANRNLSEYRAYGFPVISDNSSGYQGPMAGIAAAIPHCRHEWVLVIPCDMPYLPTTLVERLYSGKGKSSISIAEVRDSLNQNYLQLAFLINRSMQVLLKQSLDNNQLKLMHWIKQQDTTVIPFTKKENFKNFNHLTDFV